MKSLKVSVIYVNYKSLKLLIESIKSIKRYKPDLNFEIIVVDNDESSNNEEIINKYTKNVLYIQSHSNIGYGAGINLGAKFANGKYLLILNPDTIVEKGSIEKLVSFLERHKKAAIVAPLLTDIKGKVYRQGSRELTPKSAIFGLSFINKLFPNNKISRNYFLDDWDMKSTKKVDVVPGTAFMIKKKIFDEIGGFDSKFFLFFEESDLCKRIKEARKEIYIYPKAKIKHHWGFSTKKEKKEVIDKHFQNSRFYYFKKHYGFISAAVVEAFTRASRQHIWLLFVIILGAFLRFYNLDENLRFNGELGYNYLEIKNIIERGEIPLIGPQTSHEWFFVGPLFYWLFAIVLPLGGYHPLAGAVFFALMGIIFIFISYFILKNIFNKYVALLSAYLMAISPWWVIITKQSRYNVFIAYLFLPFFYLLIKTVKENIKYIFWVGFILGVMSNFFPSFILLIPAALIVIFIYKRKIKVVHLIKLIVGFLIPNFPLIIYEIKNDFGITVNLIKWVPYRILGFVGIVPKNNASLSTLNFNFTSFYNFFKDSFLYTNSVIVLLIFITLAIFVIVYSKRKIKEYRKNIEYFSLIIITVVSCAGLFIHGNPPSHYYYVILPAPIILLSLFFYELKKTSVGRIFAGALILYLTILNMSFYFSDKWFYKKYDTYYKNTPRYSVQEQVADKIVEDAKGVRFSIKRVGILDNFGYNFAQNYRYILWMKGNEPIDNSNIVYTIYEYTDNLEPERVDKVIWVGNIAITKKVK